MTNGSTEWPIINPNKAAISWWMKLLRGVLVVIITSAILGFFGGQAYMVRTAWTNSILLTNMDKKIDTAIADGIKQDGAIIDLGKELQQTRRVVRSIEKDAVTKDWINLNFVRK